MSGDVRRSQAEFGSDYVVELMRALGIEYAAFNPGATFRGIHDSLVNFGDTDSLEVIEVCHEEISVAVAHGYAKATGKPMAAILHDMVGLQHGSMAIYNAWVDRAPVFLMGGTGPMDTTRRRPWIDWIHTANVQGNQIRDYTKFDDQPTSLAAVPESMLRAYRTMMIEPRGPVYVNFDVDIQEERVGQPLEIPPVEQYVTATRMQADPAALAQIVDWLVGASAPVILTSTVGRHPQTVPALVKLAELLAAPVISTGQRLNIPTTHPLNLTGAEAEILDRADLILALDVNDLQRPLLRLDPKARGGQIALGSQTARLIQVGLADLGVRSWAHDFLALYPTNLSVLADTSLAVPALVDLVQQRLADGSAPTGSARTAEERDRRRRELADLHGKIRTKWREQAQRETSATPISLAHLSGSVWEAVKDANPVLAFNGFNPWPLRLWDLSEPHQWPGDSGGAGVGYGIGGAAGVTLAHRGTDRLCVSLQPDGDLLYDTSALWTLAHYRLPLLMVMHNNRSYYNSEEHAQRMAEARGRSMERSGIGVRIDDPAVDFATVARGFGIWSEGPIEDPDALAPALRRAIQIVQQERRPALIDVVTAPR